MPSKRHESENVDPKPLGEPLHFEFSDRTAENRFMKAAMTERLSSWDPKNFDVRGIPSKNLINLYRRWGEGGFGVILTGNFMLEPDQLEAPGNPIVPAGAPHSGERFEAFKEMATQGKKHGSLMVAQVSHPGRQVEDRVNAHPVSASDVQLQGEVMYMRFAKPRALSLDEIHAMVRRWGDVAAYLDAAGYDGIELHGAHGYLLAQFLSPTTNLRDDAYGGSLENRARIVLEIGREVRQRTRPGFVLGIKMNSVEFQDRGFTPDEARTLATLLERERFDFIELSGGTYEKFVFRHERESTRKREAFFLEFAELIAPALSRTRVYITGGLKTAGAMVGALSGSIDGVGLARPAAQEPNLPRDILAHRVKGAIEMAVDADNFAFFNAIAGAQMRQLGKDHQPIDMSVQANVDAFTKDVAAWREKLADDPEILEYGFADILGVVPVPYGTAST